ncbi:hypothetical protein [Pseudomarimonas arenosa]|uniref:Uncharacterized protein n=1 Tax=Pseudomarimonas arenosa TaxID=2774145 RepID=A0AAW3ZN99_9GAMM|nr:hypothetical protein [Pseudomarimonas arenosa]MBD8527628.1 hypothetical protein [Pseudomarimonas arenosa]
MGEDSSGRPGFYTAATRYFAARLNAGDLMVTSARSWAEVRERLVEANAQGAQPWRRIVLVVHGSQWSGLSLPVFEASGEVPRASELRTLIESRAFPPLPAGIVDHRSTLVLESCGLGRRTDLMQVYSRLLFGTDENRTEASSGLVEFVAHTAPYDNRTERRVRPYQAKVHRWPSETGGVSGEADGWTRIPVKLEVAVAAEQCREQAAGGIARSAAVRTTLSDFGLAPGQLRWRIERSESGCKLLGSATVMTSEAQPVSAIGDRG